MIPESDFRENSHGTLSVAARMDVTHAMAAPMAAQAVLGPSVVQRAKTRFCS